MITLGATQPGVTLDVAADAMFTVPVNGAQLPSAFRATIQNVGPASDTFNVTFTGVPSGFTVQDSAGSFVIPPGSVATDGIYIVPTGALPAPGTQVNFTVTVTSASNSAITASQALSFTVPAIQALTMTASPTALSTTPSTGVMSTLSLQSVGNVAVTATLAAVTDPNLTLSGLSPSITLGAGQSTTQTLTITPGANAPLSVPLSVNLTATFGSSETASASATVQVNAIQALAAVGAAASATTLGRTDIAATLSGLSGAIDTAISSCSPAAQAEVVSIRQQPDSGDERAVPGELRGDISIRRGGDFGGYLLEYRRGTDATQQRSGESEHRPSIARGISVQSRAATQLRGCAAWRLPRFSRLFCKTIRRTTNTYAEPGLASGGSHRRVEHHVPSRRERPFR